ncbi:MAG: hypothetical protein GXO25_04470 [Euryarchaeota archaeon]|nr:hypothetical protein [Euryarchaeota archaeon]
MVSEGVDINAILRHGVSEECEYSYYTVSGTVAGENEQFIMLKNVYILSRGALHRADMLAIAKDKIVDIEIGASEESLIQSAEDTAINKLNENYLFRGSMLGMVLFSITVIAYKFLY